MGSCGSTNKPKPEFNFRGNQNNQEEEVKASSYKSNQINVNQNQQSQNVNLMSTKDYPRGKANLLKKIQGTINTEDNLKKPVELFVKLSQLPAPGTYTCEIIIHEEGGKSLPLAKLQPENSDSNNQIVFGTSLEMNYFFERDQKLEIKVIEIQNGKSYIVQESVANIASSKNPTVLKDNKSSLIVELKMQAIKSEKKTYTFQVKVETKDNDLQGQELYLIVKNFNDNISWRNNYKSEESRNMAFEPIHLVEDDLFLGDPSRNFRIELYKHASPYIYGYCETSIKSLENNKVVSIISSSSNQPTQTTLNFNVEVHETYSFIDLLKKGLQISLMVAVDFTASNGNPSRPNSLHYTLGPEPNLYERAIRSCGNIIAYYDNDKQFPLLGFGGIPKGSEEVQHVFPLNFSDNPNVNGISEMVNVYKNSLTMTELNGPTFFAPLLQKLCELIKQTKGVYTIVMILTDGQINDMEETIDAIVECSFLPISIIIIGIGNANFSGMDRLDGDDLPLTDSRGRGIARDIVQFVPFNKYEGNSKKLSEEVLKELPRQVEQFYVQRNIV